MRDSAPRFIAKLAALSILAALAPCPVSAAGPPADLRKYLQPAGITKLDWLLLKAEVESFTGDIRWDDYHLIQSVALYSIPKRAFVGMTFLVTKERYTALSDGVTRKVFADVVVTVCNILKLTIPEVNNGENVYANFVTVGESGGVIATYDEGKVTFAK